MNRQQGIAQEKREAWEPMGFRAFSLRKSMEARVFLSEDRVKDAVVTKLNSMGYRMVSLKSSGEKGPDITAEHQKYPRRFVIEVKGDSLAKSNRSGREVRFLQSLGQLLTRISPRSGYYYGLAYPVSYKHMVIHRLNPDLLKLLHIHLFFVDGNKQVEVLKWEGVKMLRDAKKANAKK